MGLCIQLQKTKQNKKHAVVVPNPGNSHWSTCLGNDDAATETCTNVNGKLIIVITCNNLIGLQQHQ